MTDSPNTTARSTAQDGDIVVTRESSSAIRYAVRQLPGVVQFTASARDEAVSLAQGFAQKHAVDLWYQENGSDRRLGSYRPSPASRIRRRAS